MADRIKIECTTTGTQILLKINKTSAVDIMVETGKPGMNKAYDQNLNCTIFTPSSTITWSSKITANGCNFQIFLISTSRSWNRSVVELNHWYLLVRSELDSTIVSQKSAIQDKMLNTPWIKDLNYCFTIWESKLIDLCTIYYILYDPRYLSIVRSWNINILHFRSL